MTNPFFNPKPTAPIGRIVDAMRGDLGNEPPPRAVAEAKALGRRLEHRRAAGLTMFGAVGELFDRAGATVLQWLDPESGMALAGVRDDRGADLLEATIDSAELVIRAERTPAQDGVVRLVGEVMTKTDDLPVKARLAVLDASGVIREIDSTDSLGMFAIGLPDDAHTLVVSARAADGSEYPTIVLPLGPDSETGSVSPGEAGAG